MLSNSQRSTTDQTRTYDRANSVVFLKTRELFGGLSNMAGGFPLHVQGTRIYTSEALYQACRFPHLPEVQRLIIGQASPMTAKMKSKPYRKDSRPDWDRVRVKVMRWCLRVKLAQNWEKFSELLLRTGERPIVEESRKDDFWGAKPSGEPTLVGMNVLGRLLMELREAVRSQDPQSLQVVESPDIPEFLLFGRPIHAIGRRNFELQESALTSAAQVPDRVVVQGPPEQPLLFNASSASDNPPPLSGVRALGSAPLSDLKPYAAMRYSGLPWLGNVPGHWTAYKLRHLLDRVAERNRPDLPLLSVVREKGVVLRDLSNSEDNHNFIPDDLSNYKVVRRGQFAMNKMKAWQGSYGVSEHDGIVSPAYFVFTLRRAEGRFFHAAIRSRAYVPSFTQASDGVRIGQWDLSETRMREIPFFVPTPPEQSAIVRFLNHADRRIRRYIHAKQRLIKLLEEQKQIIVHKAVTRGLEPSVRLRPSGVEWLGDVPEHWEVLSLRRVITRAVDGPHHSPTYVDSGIPFLSARNIKTDRWSLEDAKYISEQDYAEFSKRIVPEVGDVLYTKGGTTGVARAVDLDFRFQVWVHVAVLKVKRHKVVPGYLALVLNSPRCYEQAQLFTRGATNQDLGLGRMKGIVFALPPRAEQETVLKVLDERTRDLAQTIQRARREIDLLREYRIRLVADLVTGKLDVRDVASRLPDEVAEQPLDEAEGDPESEESDEGLEAVSDEVGA